MEKSYLTKEDINKNVLVSDFLIRQHGSQRMGMHQSRDGRQGY